MDIGTGIALAGIWVFVGVSWQSTNVGALGMWITLLTGIGLTLCMV